MIVTAQVAILVELNRQISGLESELTAHFEQVSQERRSHVTAHHPIRPNPARHQPVDQKRAAAPCRHRLGIPRRQTITRRRRLHQQKRDTGADHHQALRAVANRLVGILHGCLQHRTPYNEDTAWAHRHTQAA